ncbi:MAG: DEAD/DEAH box helicase [Thermoplasmataceae archaeon]
MDRFGKFLLKKKLLDNLADMEFFSPTEVQELTIPEALKGSDLVVRSKTGSGKTGAFLIPIIEASAGSHMMESLVITPTRELAMQVSQVALDLSKGMTFRLATVYGGASINRQIDELSKGVDMVVGTPGRIIDLMKRGHLSLKNVRTLVLDEADIMLDMGFIDDIEYIIRKIPERRQILMLSASMPEGIVKLAGKFLKNYKYVSLSSDEKPVVESVFNTFVVSDNGNKVSTLLAYFNEYSPEKSIIFVEQKRDAQKLYEIMRDMGINSVVMHGDLTQAQREKSLMEFRETTPVLIATNVAARGLDITDVTDIINFDVPSDATVYLHRVGRTARFNRAGQALTIVENDEIELIENIERNLNIRMSSIKLNEEQFSGVPAIYEGRRFVRNSSPRSWQGNRGRQRSTYSNQSRFRRR